MSAFEGPVDGNESDSSAHESVNYAPSWVHRFSTADEEILPEQETRYTHKVQKRVRIQSEKKQVHDLNSTADKIAFNANRGSVPDMNRINDNAEVSALLEDMERNPKAGGLGSEGGGLVNYVVGLAKAGINGVVHSDPSRPHSLRGRTPTITLSAKSLFDRLRTRKNSLDSAGTAEFSAGDKRKLTGWRLFLVQARHTVEYLMPDLYFRLNVYLTAVLLVAIALVAREFENPAALFKLCICTVLLEFGCSMLDRVAHRVIDLLFVTHFDIAYQLHSLNGPLGLIITVLIVRNYWQSLLRAEDLVRGWRSYVTAAAVFIICLCAKNWIGRRQYVYLLERRFADKVESLNSMIIILSELASSRPPRSVQLQRTMSRISEGEDSVSAHSTVTLGGTRVAKITAKVRDVFEDLVEATDDNSSDEAITRKTLYRKRRSFWQSAARLSQTAGVMKVITYNGVVTLRSQDQARQFGQKLYRHLSKGGKVVVNSELIRKLFEERREAVAGDQAERAEHEHAIASITSQHASASILDPNSEERKELWSVAAGLFDPFGLGRVSEEFCVEAVVNIYKEQRFTAASINDFGELHQSLRLGIDIIYWIIMLFVLQSLFGFDITAYLLPFITLIISFSFAISNLVGNVFLCFAFVFFMAPYDIGHRVQLGLSHIYIPAIIGNVKSITLLYTVITTNKNETVKVPNHTLFTEKIYNMTETAGAVQEFSITFNMGGGEHASMDRINSFFQRLKHYTLRESREWKSFMVTYAGVNAAENSVEFKVYAVHREGWAFVKAVSAAKIEYHAAIKRLREDLGLVYVRVAQPIIIMSQQRQQRELGIGGGGDDGDGGEGGHSSGAGGQSVAGATGASDPISVVAKDDADGLEESNVDFRNESAVEVQTPPKTQSKIQTQAQTPAGSALPGSSNSSKATGGVTGTVHVATSLPFSGNTHVLGGPAAPGASLAAGVGAAGALDRNQVRRGSPSGRGRAPSSSL